MSEGQSVCQRCGELAVVSSRKELFCGRCFVKFISLKQRKQMMSKPYFQEIFKVMHGDKIRSSEDADAKNRSSKVLVALSLGSSSTAMLDILNDTLNEQKATQRGRIGFHVDALLCHFASEYKNIKSHLGQLWAARYKDNWENITFHLVKLESFFDGKELGKLILNNDYSCCFNAEHHPYELRDLLDQCPNRSSREDLVSLIIRCLVERFAYQHDHKAILWGYSMTKLGNETISSIVKGRGEHINYPFNRSQLEQNHDTKFKHLCPLKDILLSEIDAYCYLVGLYKHLVNYTPRQTLLLRKNRSPKSVNNKLVKDMTINEIIGKYFDDIEGDYSNVISTVVRTADKLIEPKSLDAHVKCTLCLSNIHTNASEWLQTISINCGCPPETEDDHQLYRKWYESDLRMEKEEHSELMKAIISQGDAAPLCYGCIVTLSGASDKSIIWPRRMEQELNQTLGKSVLPDEQN